MEQFKEYLFKPDLYANPSLASQYEASLWDMLLKRHKPKNKRAATLLEKHFHLPAYIKRRHYFRHYPLGKMRLKDIGKYEMILFLSPIEALEKASLAVCLSSHAGGIATHLDGNIHRIAHTHFTKKDIMFLDKTPAYKISKTSLQPNDWRSLAILVMSGTRTLVECLMGNGPLRRRFVERFSVCDFTGRGAILVNSKIKKQFVEELCDRFLPPLS